MNTKKSPYQSLKMLGTAQRGFPTEPSHKIMEVFPNRYSKRNYWVEFQGRDFTSLCPVTGQPDFAHLIVRYVPDKLCIETKSFKFYLASYRNVRSFNEEIANRVLEDVLKACDPKHITVRGEFVSRGGVSLTVEVTHLRKKR